MTSRAHRPVRDRRVAAGLALAGALAVAGLTGSFLLATAVRDPKAPTLHEPHAPAGPARTLEVAAGGDFDAALRAARPGDVIRLEAGAVFEGPFRLPAKSGDGWVTIRTSTPDDRLPPPGTRIQPTQAALLASLVSSSESVLIADEGAHHYRFVGLEIRPREGAFLYDLVRLGPAGTEAALPHHFHFERCYIHGDPAKGGRRGLALNARHVSVRDSHLSDFKEVGADSQAACGWSGPGPFELVNNYLEAAGENVMFGGADPTIRELVPSDIEIRGNHFAKPLAWRDGGDHDGGRRWSVKNLFELKNARRVVVDGNLFEYNWAHAQDGFAILLTVRNQDGTAPWSVVEDVTFTNNVVRHAGSGVNILGRDNAGGPSRQTSNIRIRNNLFVDIDGSRWGGKGALFQIIEGTAGVVIENNTAFQSGSIAIAEGSPHAGFAFRDNIAIHNEYGVVGTGVGVGRAALGRYFPGSDFRGNVLIGGPAALYPTGNFFPAKREAVGFGSGVDRYRLLPSSPYHRTGVGGRSAGIDFEELSGALGALAPLALEDFSPPPGNRGGESF